MSRYVYPAIFTKEESGLISVEFPDFDACFTQGNGLEDSLDMARDVLELTLCDMEDNGIKAPTPSEPTGIKTETNAFVSLVCADTTAYRKKYSGRAVKKTLTIPEWLNVAAENQNVNFSMTLQNALMEQLNIRQ